MEAAMVPQSGAALKPRTVLTSADKNPDDMVGMDTGSETWSRIPVQRAGRNNVPGASLGDRVRRCFSVVGVAVTSTAATALAAGTPTPATGFALFVLQLGGLSLVSLGVVGAASGHGCDGDDGPIA